MAPIPFEYRTPSRSTSGPQEIAAWLSLPLDPGPGWVRRSDGKWLDSSEQLRLCSQLDLPQTLALLARARTEPSSLLYLIEHAARLHAGRGELEKMHAQVASIAQVTTTPALEFELAGWLPPSLSAAERQRLLDSFDIEPRLVDTRRTASLLTCFLWSEHAAEVLPAVARLTDPMFRLECWGLVTMVAKSGLDVRDRIVAECEILSNLIDLESRYAEAAVCTLDRPRFEAIWERWLPSRRPGQPLPWRAVTRLLGPAAIEEHLRTLMGRPKP